MRRFALKAMFLSLISVLGIILPRSTFAEKQDNAKTLRVAIAQIPVSADIATNAATIHRALDKAIEAKAEILLTPEGSLSGYTHLFDQKQVDKHLPAILKKARRAHLALALGTCFVEPHDRKCYNQIRFNVHHGDVDADVTPQPDGKPLLFVTPQAEARVMGTRLSISAETSATTLSVSEGHVVMKRLSDGRSVDVHGGFHAVASSSSELTARPAPSVPDTWSADFEDRR